MEEILTKNYLFKINRKNVVTWFALLIVTGIKSKSRNVKNDRKLEISFWNQNERGEKRKSRITGLS